MPALDCSFYETMEADLKEFLKAVKKLRHDGGTLCTFPLDYKKWKESDLTQLANDENCVPFFESLVLAAEGSNELTSDKTDYTENAKCAGRALDAVKPNCCKTRDDFYRMIVRVAKATEETRKKMKTDHPERFHDVPEFPPKKKDHGSVLPVLYKDIAHADPETAVPFNHQEEMAKFAKLVSLTPEHVTHSLGFKDKPVKVASLAA